jgi:TolB protein
MRIASLLTLAVMLVPTPLAAQWTNRYPHVEGFGHHVYLEGFELPIMNAGPMDPAPSPLGREIAFSSKGWLWVMDLETGHARRVTSSAAVDARPEWSPDGRELVFTRDDGSQLSIVSLNLRSGRERVLVDVEAVNLDPAFSRDGKSVYYSSAESGQLHLWRVALDSLERQQVSPPVPLQRRPLKRRPLELASDSLLVYLSKQSTSDSIEILNTVTNTSTRLVGDRLAAQADMALDPESKYLAYTWPQEGGYELRLLAIAEPDTSVLLTRSRGMPLAPAFSHDGQWIYFSEANDDERMELMRVSVRGGTAETVAVRQMDWGAATGQLLIRSSVDGQPAAVRMSVLDHAGHPLVPEFGASRSEGQNGRVFFYSNGEIELVAPTGNVTISAVHGFETAEGVVQARVRSNRTTEVSLDLESIWDASENGWYSADNHFHLNYGGTYRLSPDDILPDMAGEGVDLAYPLLANLHNRFLQQELWGWSQAEDPIIHFGQEVRSHFLGHVGLLGTGKLFWPWVWGPSYQLYARDDRTNAEALRHARAEGGLGGYVHPVDARDPFTPETYSAVPVGFVADAVLGEVDLIEVACLWSDEIGTAAVWHEVLNLGIPLAASAGSDVMNDYFRTMAIGATRVYVRPGGKMDSASFMRALKQGRSFVSTGPMIDFQVNGKRPGEAVEPADGTVDWTLDVHSALPYDSVEIYVNGAVVERLEGQDKSGSSSHRGTVQVPAGGWISARVLGESTGWPALGSYLFAQSSPVWLGEVGSTDPEAARAAAGKLLLVLENSENELKRGYGNAPIPKLLEHFGKARKRLESIAR